MALNAGWDEELLNAELAALEQEGFDIELTGFSDLELDELLHGEAEVQEDDPGPLIDKSGELQRKWSTAAGQIWEIPSKTVKGKAHRLMCGDFTDVEQVKTLMAGKRAVLFATDPPYLVGYDGMNHPANRKKNNKSKDWSGSYGITWDEAKVGENQDLYDRFIKTAVEVAIQKNAAWYCWHASRNQIMVEEVWNKYGAFVHQTIIWAKSRAVLTYSVYLWGHEPCFFGWVKGSKLNVNKYNSVATVWNLSSANFKERNHPTSKPVECFGIPIEMHTRRGEICYEPFAGSGSQLVADEQLGRIVYDCEIAPPYVDVCLERMVETLGLEPKLVK